MNKQSGKSELNIKAFSRPASKRDSQKACINNCRERHIRIEYEVVDVNKPLSSMSSAL